MGLTIAALIEGRSDFYWVLASDTIRKAAAYMSARKIGAVAVRDADGVFCGVFSERDLLNRVVAAGRDPDAVPVGEVMSATLVTAGPEESCLAASARMEAARTRHLLVMNSGEYRGMISQSDITRAYLRDVSEERDLLKRYAFS